MTFEHPDGSLDSVPVGWTDVGVPDPYLHVGRGRSRFRLEDLLRLAERVQQAAGASGEGGERGVRPISSSSSTLFRPDDSEPKKKINP